jgi:hypothetical protein
MTFEGFTHAAKEYYQINDPFLYGLIRLAEDAGLPATYWQTHPYLWFLTDFKLLNRTHGTRKNMTALSFSRGFGAQSRSISRLFGCFYSLAQATGLPSADSDQGRSDQDQQSIDPEFPFCLSLSTPRIDQPASLGKVLAQFGRFWSTVPPAAPGWVGLASRGHATTRNAVSPIDSADTSPFLSRHRKSPALCGPPIRLEPAGSQSSAACLQNSLGVR